LKIISVAGSAIQCSLLYVAIRQQQLVLERAVLTPVTFSTAHAVYSTTIYGMIPFVYIDFVAVLVTWRLLLSLQHYLGQLTEDSVGT
jgi:hypothetical protein